MTEQIVLTLPGHHRPRRRRLRGVRPGRDAGAPSRVRAAFHEGRWAVANQVRTVLEVGALALLFLAGRA